MKLSKKQMTATFMTAVLVVIVGGGYYYASHSIAKHLPGHVYEYTSVSGNQNAYMTFADNGDQVIVTPDKDTALKTSNSASDFQKIYKENAKSGKWNYKAQGNKLTISKLQDNKVSLWQYNDMLV